MTAATMVGNSEMLTEVSSAKETALTRVENWEMMTAVNWVEMKVQMKVD